MRFPTKVDHALAVINLYFTLGRPKYWLYEPQEKFTHLGKEMVWAPDCIFVHGKKVYVCEMQLTPIRKARWKKKWSVYNQYFSRDNFLSAAFQKWSPRPLFPQFLVITSQHPETVKAGFEIKDRDLIVCREFR